MQRYKDYIVNIYHDHAVVSFECPGTPGRRTLLVPLSAAVAECETHSAAVALAKRRSPPADAAPTSELRPPLFGFNADGELEQKGAEAAVAKFMGIEAAEQFPLEPVA